MRDNASCAATQATDIERRAIAYAKEHGTVLVVAAGNDGTSEPTYPAVYPDDNVIAVAATTDRDRLASFSNDNRTEAPAARSSRPVSIASVVAAEIARSGSPLATVAP